MCRDCAARVSRRALLALAGSGVLNLLPAPGYGKAGARGCWLRSVGGEGAPSERLASSGDRDIDAFCERERESLAKLYGVRPSLHFFEGEDSYNAFASPDVADRQSPHGSVLFGAALARDLWSKYRADNALPLAAVMAHEWGHILQFRSRYATAWGVTYELNADHASGWYLLKTRGYEALLPHRRVLSEFLAALGDRAFNNFEYHGLPTQRSYSLLDGAHLLATERALADSLSLTPQAALRID